MVQYGAGGGDAIAHVAAAEGTDENFVDGNDEHLSKGLVVVIILIEDCGGNFMGVAKVGNLGTQRNRWDGGLGAGVNQRDESRGQECCVHDGGNSEFQYSKCAAAQVRLDKYGVRVQF